MPSFADPGLLQNEYFSPTLTDALNASSSDVNSLFPSTADDPFNPEPMASDPSGFSGLSDFQPPADTFAPPPDLSSGGWDETGFEESGSGDSSIGSSSYNGNDFGDSSFGGFYGGGYYGPIILDLGGNGIDIRQLSSSNSFFDMAGDGAQRLTAWAGAGDGVLFYDPTGGGQLTQANQIVFADWDPTAASDMQALLDVFDTNHDGALDAGDTDFSKFFVMETNADGSETPASLSSLGITSIDLDADATAIALPDGSAIDGETTYTTTSGSGLAATVTLAVDPIGQVVTASRGFPTCRTSSRRPTHSRRRPTCHRSSDFGAMSLPDTIATPASSPISSPMLCVSQTTAA
ncbi:MAG TPA: hypothetical protein VFI22_15890 [Thermomicrobiales bacterium]|nr:hypothetical protein [Thermomicrobiales bacterium]